MDPLDLNNNGVPDWREPWAWRAVWSVVMFVRTFAADHTLFARGVDEAERLRKEALGVKF